MEATCDSQNFAVPRDPTSPEIANFLASRSGSEMVQLVQSLRDPMAQAAMTTALFYLPPAASGRVATPEKAKKALNAFVGFRCYYITMPVFKAWQMKKLSTPVGMLWDADPNKSLWSLMTKAWSIIRDQIGKEKAPLDEFFKIVCPHLGIPSPETYLQKVGWEFGLNKDGDPAVTRSVSYVEGSLNAGAAPATAISVEDIIRYSMVMGYALGQAIDTNFASSTFLGQSPGSANGTSSARAPATSTPGAFHDERVAVKNKRREKRTIARQTGFGSDLHQQYFRALDLEGGVKIPEDQAQLLQSENGRNTADDQFYADTHRTLTNHISGTENEEEAPRIPCVLPTMAEYIAFRRGANANATLPTLARGNSNTM